MTKILQALTWTPGEVKTSFQKKKKKKEREKREKENKRDSDVFGLEMRYTFR